MKFVVLLFASLTLFIGCRAPQSPVPLVTQLPVEATNAVLHNPDMGWVLYENYPLDLEPGGSSSLLSTPNEDFPKVDTVALMFTWQDIEKHQDDYDFSKVDYAYDYWSKRGKEIQLRMSTTTLMWWASRNPPTGTGAPEYVRERMSPGEKQTRILEGVPYVVEDVRNTFYRDRLTKFLKQVDTHFSGERKVSLIDLRGFGLWGEWHSGFKYPTVGERRDALKGVIDLWSQALPNHRLALCFSYDPDGPKELYAGSTKEFNEQFTTHYTDFLNYSGFDYALTKPNITWRRDGCGGAVHSNERKFNEETFRRGRGPFVCEFVDGFAQSKKGSANWLNWKIDDALSLHPNYVNLLGWQSGDALAFLRERPDLIDYGLRRMGYRLVPTRIQYPANITSGAPFQLNMDWVNRGVGRALRDYELRLLLLDSNHRTVATTTTGVIGTSRWISGESYPVRVKAKFAKVAPGNYQLGLALRDPKTGRSIALPLANLGPDGAYEIGDIHVAAGGKN